MHTLPNISQSKGNYANKFIQLLEYRKVFFKKQAENEPGRLVPDIFFKKKMALNEVKASSIFR